MENKLTQLYNTLSQIETKGMSTKLMSSCLQFVENMINEERAAKTEEPKTPKAKTGKTNA